MDSATRQRNGIGMWDDVEAQLKTGRTELALRYPALTHLSDTSGRGLR